MPPLTLPVAEVISVPRSTVFSMIVPVIGARTLASASWMRALSSATWLRTTAARAFA